ncbi:MAG: carboxypeptidase-like regulatory domain-containing protein [Candidatus Calditenuis sp.]|nr:carboxypeptidase-like regulatory domain-containing protein [Candidatus Calditenuis sp.]
MRGLRGVQGSLWPVVVAVLLMLATQVPMTALAEEGSLVVEVLRSPDPYEVKIVIEGPGGTWTFEGRSSVSLTGVTSGTYTVKVYYRGYLVATRAVVVNRDNIALSIPIPFVDVVLRAVDLKGRELSGRLYAKVEPRDGYSDLTVSGSSIVIRRALEPVAYSVYVEWESPLYAKRASANLTEPAWSLVRRGTVQLPVTDLAISVIDKEGKGVGGAEVRIANQVLTTGDDGRIVVQRVPVEYRGEPVSYDLEVRYMGYLVYRGSVLTSTTNYAFTFTADLRKLTVLVLGEAGQGIPNAKVSLLREGNEVGTAFTDSGGRASFEGVIPVEHFLRVEYKSLSQTLRLLPSQMTGRPITVQLPVYVELGGVPLSTVQLYVLVGGAVIAVIAVAVSAFLLVRRRARKVRVVGPIY